MSWPIEYDPGAVKDLKRLDRPVAKRIVNFLNQRIAAADNPRSVGKVLKGPLGDLWRYRVGDYRVICHIEDTKMTVLVIRIGHRGQVYS